MEERVSKIETSSSCLVIANLAASASKYFFGVAKSTFVIRRTR
ncbi:hypothetical protein GQ600_24260 [Phytophthora cactorum]|nr:hypothetical protein GQ600_24260 [Phytophthora cactorum]